MALQETGVYAFEVSFEVVISMKFSHHFLILDPWSKDLNVTYICSGLKSTKMLLFISKNASMLVGKPHHIIFS